MKEWPKVLQDRFPTDALWPARPWWRRDGCVDRRAYMQRRGERTDGGTFGVFASEPEAAEGVDRHYPLPFPGIRVGQVWAIVYETGEPAIFQITEYDVDHEDVRACINGFGHTVYVRKPKQWLAGGSWISEEELLDLCRDAYLVADVACPHLAPWAPAAAP